MVFEGIEYDVFTRFGKSPDQIAFGTRDISWAERIFKDWLGCETPWIRDIVTAKGTILEPSSGTILEGTNVAELSFNYSHNFEIELIRYVDGPNWHYYHRYMMNSFFISHVGIHVDQSSMDKINDYMNAHKVPIVQEVITQTHLNPHIKDSRRYNYIIYGTNRFLGFDVKLIRRLNLDLTPFVENKEDIQ